MKFKVVKISGLDDAMVSLRMSKRTYNEQLSQEIRDLVDSNTDKNGFVVNNVDEKFIDELKKLEKYGIQYNHSTLLRYIDITIETIGLHRGAQDDLDAHAYRMSNRMVRNSTRLAKFNLGEKSDYYKDKILFFDEVIAYPDKLEKDGVKYVKTPYGYTRGDLVNNFDALRGNYPLSIPSDCIWKCNFIDLRHIYKMRNEKGYANPELKQGIEMMADQIEKYLPVLGQYIRRESVKTEDGVKPVHCMDTVTVSKEYLEKLKECEYMYKELKK